MVALAELLLKAQLVDLPLHLLILVYWHNFLSLIRVVALGAHLVPLVFSKVNRKTFVILDFKIDDHVVIVPFTILIIECFLLFDDNLCDIFLFQSFITRS